MPKLDKYEAIMILSILVVDIVCTYFIYKEYKLMQSGGH